MSSPPRVSHPVAAQLARAEDMLLCLLLTLMLFLACLQIVLRFFFSGGLLWADPLLRYLVLWCGLLGALKATGEGKHIALDFSQYLIPGSLRPWITIITDLFCTFTTAALTLAAWFFIQSEMEFGTTGLLFLPSWVWNLIFPVTFAAMSLRYGISTVTGLISHYRPPSQKGDAAK